MQAVPDAQSFLPPGSRLALAAGSTSGALTLTCALWSLPFFFFAACRGRGPRLLSLPAAALLCLGFCLASPGRERDAVGATRHRYKKLVRAVAESAVSRRPSLSPPLPLLRRASPVAVLHVLLPVGRAIGRRRSRPLDLATLVSGLPWPSRAVVWIRHPCRAATSISRRPSARRRPLSASCRRKGLDLSLLRRLVLPLFDPAVLIPLEATLAGLIHTNETSTPLRPSTHSSSPAHLRQA
ncbi:hypothetical protein CDD83_2456 [Cordyceps sp. RAO-2017]|nr:hypothetical protein CDD83_2456 [Cordyceps sp. RAO-2017]